MKKRIQSLFACLCMVVCMLPTVSFADEIADDISVNSSQHNASAITDFADVKLNTYYANAVEWAIKREITTGTSSTTFSPNQVCTRAQVVTFLWREYGEPEPNSSYNPFYDISSSDYYYKAVLWAVENNITNGMTYNTFEPDRGCTRGQVVTFMWRAAGKPYSSYDNVWFEDVSRWGYYSKAVAWAVEENITKGTSDSTFSPDKICTRGQIVTFLYRFETNVQHDQIALNTINMFLEENGWRDDHVDYVRWYKETYNSIDYIACVSYFLDEYEYELAYCVRINNAGQGEVIGYLDGDLLLPLDDLFN